MKTTIDWFRVAMFLGAERVGDLGFDHPRAQPDWVRVGGTADLTWVAPTQNSMGPR